MLQLLFKGYTTGNCFQILVMYYMSQWRKITINKFELLDTWSVFFYFYSETHLKNDAMSFCLKKDKNWRLMRLP